MKKIVFLLVLIAQMLSASAGTISVRLAEIQPGPKVIVPGGSIALLAIQIKGSGSREIPRVSLVVRQTGVQSWEPTVFEDFCLCEYKPTSDVSAKSQIVPQRLMGYIGLTQDTWTTVIISARVAQDLSGLEGRRAGLAVDSVVIDGSVVEPGNQFLVDAPFPMSGDLHPIVVPKPAIIKNITFLDREDSKKDIFVFATVKPQTAYFLEATQNFTMWNVVGEATPEPTEVLKQHVSAMELISPVFFRLVEKP